jgi:hypothetical protein
MSIVQPTFISFAQAFRDGKLSSAELDHFIVDERVYTKTGQTLSMGSMVVECTGDDGSKIELIWKSTGSVFLAKDAHLIGDPAPIMEAECTQQVCQLLESSAMIGSIRLQATYGDVDQPQLFVSKNALRHSDGQLTQLVMETSTVYLYRDKVDETYLIPLITLEDGTMLHNVQVTIAESSCPHIVLPMRNARRS